MRKKIKVLVLDVDGTLTDGKVYIADTGELFKGFNIKDGLGIHDILPKLNIVPVVITGRKSRILEIRCKEIGIEHLYQGVGDKVSVLSSFLEESHLTFEECAYIGDDINDLECMELAAAVGCPADAVDAVKKAADYISTRNGGDGAVREFIEWLAQMDCA